MSEQKYYVFLKNKTMQKRVIQLISFGFNNELVDFATCKIGRTRKFFEGDRFQFTKSELTKIMDGALYRLSSEKCDYCRYSCGDTCGDDNCEEWINPLIELVPVEDNE